ncbi:MAG: 1,4-dihydroxy-2-naphthoate polyprenyltransferase [Candidatus Eisenbacteria bacterium]|nr:1,4-dihydroxy-2-naphthoate polyprenyltransferase [Candidatus Eisenbacteria bacterium]
MNASPPEAAPGSLRAWVLASRPATLFAAIAPVLVGTACAFHAGGFRAGPAAAALAGAVLLQIGSNLANDLFDYERGTDREDRLGPARAAQHGLITPRGLRAGMAIVFGLAAAFGVYLAAVAGWPVIVIGLLSIAAAIAYTGGPFPLGYHGLGDLFVFLFFGYAAVCGTAFVQAGRVPALAWIAAAPVGALATAILVVNNTRDCETDRRSGKRTLPARFGRRAGRIELTILILFAYASLAVPVAAGLAAAWAFLPLLTLPLAARETRTVWTAVDGPALNRSLRGTARLHFLFGALLAIGLAAGG